MPDAAVFARYRVVRAFADYAVGAVIDRTALDVSDRKVQKLTEQRWIEPVSEDEPEMPAEGPRNTSTRRRKALTT